ncbi:MAG: DMT family transporter [Candidatus Adiutrix sp.]|jgi:drug/metabolite transporter (DMT)-like permease|nr:DMT family transporter [Candidatus Adiutrix sp.]
MKSPNYLTDQRVVIGLALTACLLWGSAFPGVKAGYRLFHIQPGDTAAQLLFAGCRFTLAGLLLLLFGLVSGRKIFDLEVPDYFRLAALGLIMTTLQYFFFYLGLARVSGVKGAILTGASTFFYVGLAHLAFKNEPLRPRVILGCLAGLAGVVAVNLGAAGLDFSFSLGGEGYMVLAALVSALGGIYGKITSRQLDSVVMTAWQLTIGGLLLTLLGLGQGGAVTAGAGPLAWALLLYLSLLSSAAFALNATLLKYNPVSLVTVVQFSIPVFGAGLSALFLGESLWEWKNLAALAGVSLGIYLVTRPPGKKALF